MKKAMAAFMIIILTVIGGAAYFYYQGEDAHLSSFYQRMGERAESRGNMERAEYLYTEAVTNNPENLQARLSLSKIYIAGGDIGAAKALIEEALSFNNPGVELYTVMSLCHARELEFDQARRLVEHAQGDLVRFRLFGMSPAPPEASPAPGVYNEYISVQLAVPEGNICYYAENGNKPYGKAAKLYTGPIPLQRGENTITAVAVSENGLVSEYRTIQYTLADIVERVAFEDPAFEKMARDALSRDTGDIMTNELWVMDELSLSGGLIESFADLKHFKSLSKLSLQNVALPESLSALTAAPLRQLTMSECRLKSEDLGFLKELPDLSGLDLSGNLFSDMGFANELYNLKSLNVSRNKIESLAPLYDKKNLEHLDISDNAVIDISPLQELSALKSLFACRNRISDVKGLSGLFALEVLDMSDNMLTDISPLRQVTGIRLLNLSKNRIGDVAPLSGFLTTSELILRSNQISDLKALSTMISLEVLDISQNPVTDISPVLKLPVLQAVFSDLDEGSVSVSGTITGITIDEG